MAGRIFHTFLKNIYRPIELYFFDPGSCTRSRLKEKFLNSMCSLNDRLCFFMYKFTDADNGMNNLRKGGTFSTFYPCGQSMTTVFHFLQNAKGTIEENIFRKLDYGIDKNYKL